MVDRIELQNDIYSILIRTLNLQNLKDKIDYNTPIFENHFGLDSVDLTSAIVVIEKSYNIEFDEVTDFTKVFFNIKNIAEHIIMIKKNKCICCE